MNCAAYTVTRNQYDRVVPSIKSLMINSEVEKIYLLIEDDKFPVELPKEVECINVSRQKYFRSMGPNNVYPCAYMSMMRAALYKVLPDVDTVLSLDVDTIVDGDISGLWECALDDYYFAAVPEPDRCQMYKFYTNIGVALFNLEKLRDGKGDEIINALNQRRYMILEQDCLNELCQGAIALLPSIYNKCDFTAPCDDPAIVHYAGIRDWQDIPLVQKYKDIPWEEVRRPAKRRRRKIEVQESGVLRQDGGILSE